MIPPDMSLIDKLTVSPQSGADLWGTCRQAFLLGDALHVPVEVVHNGRRYKVGLSIQPVTVEQSESNANPDEKPKSMSTENETTEITGRDRRFR